MRTPLPRRIFFWTLFVTYTITTALVLFFVFGYQHDFSSKIFIHTGSITIAPNPQSGIGIEIDGKKPRSKLINFINDSYYISGLRPRTYSVRVTKPDFRPWEKDVSVHSGVSTEFWNITLLKNTYERTSYDIDNVDRFFPAPEENIFAATRQLGKTSSVRVFDAEENTVTHSFLFPEKQFTQDVQENIEWAPNSRELIVPLEDIATRNKDYAIAYTRTDQSYLLSDHVTLPDVHTVRWDPKDRNVIYLLSNTSLFRAELDLENAELLLTPIANDVLAYDFTDDGIYLFTTKYQVLYDYDVHGTKFEELVSFDLPENTRDVRLIAYDNHRLIVLDDENRDLYAYNKGDNAIYTKKLGTNIIGAHFSDDGKKLLFYSPFEIFTYFARDWDAQPVRREDELHSIIRFSQLIDNVHFSKDYEHIIFTVDNEIKITELDYRGNRITDTIIAIDERDSVLINKHKKNYLYFIDSTENTTRQLQSIEVPEKETLF
jgi:hypothetical protein